MKKPNNILIIVADQLSQKAVGVYGNKHASTPAIDSIADNGVRFANAYTPCPLCCPARASFWTGQLPHVTQVESNGRDWPIINVHEEISTLGTVFSKVGYECVHFGKKHDAGTLRGFDCAPENELETQGSAAWPLDYDTKRDTFTTRKAVEYLKQDHARPFVMVADINNPHDICNWIGAFKGEHDDISGPGLLPPLPDNFENEDWENRPLPIQYICCSHRRLMQASHWTESNYRHYLAAYYHYVNRADSCIEPILKALEASDAADNTLIVFMADHGDGMGAHRMVTKQVSFIEETARVPFIFAGPGISGKNRIETKQLVSLDDLFPTLCDYARLTCPNDIYGKSLMPYLSDAETDTPLREYVVSEWTTEWGFTVSPGRMIRSNRYKYTSYLEDGGEELFDLENDPGEVRSLVNVPEFKAVLEQHRAMLQRHIKETGDNFPEQEVNVDPCWREHSPGYQNHIGTCAPDFHMER